LCFDKTGRLFGLCNKPYGKYNDAIKIVELSREHKEQLTNDYPRNTKWVMRDMFEIGRYQI